MMLAAVGLAEEPAAKSASPASIVPNGWKVRSLQIPPGFFDEAFDAGLLTKAVEGQVDVRKQLRGMGLELPEGSIAEFNPTFSTLALIAPADDVEILSYMSGWCLTAPILVKVWATLVEFQVDRIAKYETLSYDRLRSVAGDTWREIEHLEQLTRTGMRGAARKRLDTKKEVRPDEEWEDGQLGTSFEVEPVLGADGRTIDINYRWHRRIAVGEKFNELDSTSTVAIQSGKSVVVACWPKELGQGKAESKISVQALVLSADVVNMKGELMRYWTAALMRESIAFQKKFKEGRLPGLEGVPGLESASPPGKSASPMLPPTR